MNESIKFHLKMIGLIFGLALAFAIIFIVFFKVGDGSVFKNDFLQAHHTKLDYSIDGNMGNISNISISDVYCHNMRGSSMNPTLFEGNTICFKEYDGQKLRQGNIIHYENKVHRIIAVQQDELIVKGDNNKLQEEVNYTNIKGILVMVLYT